MQESLFMKFVLLAINIGVRYLAAGVGYPCGVVGGRPVLEALGAAAVQVRLQNVPGVGHALVSSLV